MTRILRKTIYRLVLLFTAFTVCLFPPASFAATGAAASARPAATAIRPLPNLKEQKAYHDLVFDDYPLRYPPYCKFVTAQTTAYSLELPEGWSVNDDSLFSYILNAKGEAAGVIYTQSLDPASGLLPNHTGMLHAEQIDLGGQPALSLVYCADEPAASGITRVTVRQAIVFTSKARQTGVYLTFDKGYVDKGTVTYLMPGDTIIRMAKTFTILNK